jgi:hypothetical protein
MRELLRALIDLPARSGAAFHVAGTVTALAVGAAALPLLPGPGQGADHSEVRSHEPATGRTGAMVRVYAPSPHSMLVFVSAYVGASPEMLNWVELERERLGLSALLRAETELPLFVHETAGTAPFLAELEHQRQQLGESIIVRVAAE